MRDGDQGHYVWPKLGLDGKIPMIAPMNNDGDTLRVRNEHFEMEFWKIKNAPGGGFYMIVPCELGDHYLALVGVGVQKQLEPYVWQDSQAAWAAVERWRQERQ